ncbi:iron-containing alcohol dehydrogenase [Pandoraea anhela]|uniref:Alcohol dehydrogenase n=1 Tax=Pandoraea anhela TaxID=2508295 RepID=A0A5E4WMY8_9BURK|nr:iron-containing alcohol dehydrogenase [Pandoraea anhela]VVE26317.1 alcohol dehydrogenase [Pandoraea anhela]
MTQLFGVQRAPGTVLFGEGQRHAIGALASPFGKRALICTDTRFAASPDMQEMLAHLRASGVATEVFDGTQAELPLDNIHACVERHRAHLPDMVIGIGGGSCLDMAKLVSLALTYPNLSLDAFYGELKVPGPILPVIAIPTTSGTGSEVTPVAVLADSARDMKVGISSPFLIPRIAICDPELTLTCPPGLTAVSGADALTHAVESFMAVRRPAASDIALTRVFVGKNCLSDTHALAAIEAIFRYLPTAVADGQNWEARSMMMFASLSAGLAFSTAGTAAAHAIQYPVGALTHTAHGLGVATMLPYVMAFNARHCAQELARIAHVTGCARDDEQATARCVIDKTRALLTTIGIPATLADLGVQEDQLAWIAKQSLLSTRLIDNNPRKLDPDALQTLVVAAFRGEAIAI